MRMWGTCTSRYIDSQYRRSFFVTCWCFLVFGGTLLGARGQSAISTPHLAANGTGKRCDKHSTNSWKSWHLHRPIALNINKTSRVTLNAVYCVLKDANTTDSILPRRLCAAVSVCRWSTPTASLRKRSTSQASDRASGAGWCPRTSVRCRLISATWLTMVESLTASVTTLRDNHRELSRKLNERKTCN